MKICNRCQSQNNDDALFCSECGFKFEEESAEIVKPKRNRIKSPTEDKKTSMIKSFSVGRRSTTIAIAITATVILVITCVAVVLASNQKNIKKETVLTILGSISDTNFSIMNTAIHWTQRML